MATPPAPRRILPHAVMLAATVLLWIAARRIETGSGGRVGPDLWPKAILGFMALLCIYEIGRRLLARDSEAATGLVKMESGTVAPRATHPRMLAAGIVLIGGYVAAVPWIGFFIATTLFLAAFTWAGGFRRPVAVAVVSLAGSLALVVTFMRIAYISLPLGEGPFRAVSLALLRAIGVS